MKTNKQRLREWCNAERKKGLVSIHFTPGDVSDATVGSFCGAVMNVIDAKARGECTRIAASS